jgi:flavin-dependent dehydrogenase
VASFDTPLLIIGSGPAALVTAKVAAGRGLPCLLAGHELVDDSTPVVLDAESLAVLEPDGVLGVLRPYAASQEPFAIAPLHFEQGLKHHCIADMLVTVFDGLSVTDVVRSGAGATAVLTDGRTRWEVRADQFIDVGGLPGDLNDAIHHAAEVVAKAIAAAG